MHHARNACQRALRSTDVHHCQHIWISDALLIDTYNRFYRSRTCSKRHGSNVPGPLEAQRRLAKRRMMGCAGVAPGLLPFTGAWLTNGPPKRDELHYRAPGDKEYDVVEITINGQLIRDICSRLVDVALPFFRNSKQREAEVNMNKSTQQIKQAGDVTVQPWSEASVTAITDPILLSHENSFLLLLDSKPKLQEIRKYLMDPMRSPLGSGNMSAFLDHVGTWSHPWLQQGEFVDIFVKVVEAGLIDDKQMISIISRLDLISPSRRWSQNLYTRLSLAAYNSPSIFDKTAILQHLGRQSLLHDSCPKPAEENDQWNIYRLVNIVVDRFGVIIADCARAMGAADTQVTPKNILKTLTRVTSSDASSVGTTSPTATVHLARIVQLLRKDCDANNYQAIVEVTRSLKRDNPAELVKVWIGCLQEVLDDDFWVCSLIDPQEDSVLREQAEHDMTICHDKASVMRNIYSALATRFSYHELPYHFEWLGPERAVHTIAVFWYPQAFKDLHSIGSCSLSPSSRSLTRVFHDDVVEMTQLHKCTRGAGCYAMLLATFVKHGVLTKSYQANMLQFVSALYGGAYVVRLLKYLQEWSIRLYPGPVQALICETIDKEPRLAHSMHRAHPMWPSRIPKLVIGLIKDGQTAPADIFKLLKDKDEKNLLQDPAGQRSRAELVNAMSAAFAAQEKYSNNAAFNAIYRCYRYLSVKRLAILPDLTKALVKAGISRPLMNQMPIQRDRYNWILDMVKRVEGKDVAAAVDAEACQWRLESVNTTESIMRISTDNHVHHGANRRQLPLVSSVPSRLFEQMENQGISKEEVIAQHHLNRAELGRARRTRLANAWRRTRRNGKYSSANQNSVVEGDYRDGRKRNTPSPRDVPKEQITSSRDQMVSMTGLTTCGNRGQTLQARKGKPKLENSVVDALTATERKAASGPLRHSSNANSEAWNAV